MDGGAKRDEVRPLVHVGYHKTGSTWLQGSLFRCAAAGFRSPFERRVLIDELVLPNALRFSAERARARLRPGLAATIERGEVPVLSHERLSGNPHSGGFDSRELAHRLAAVIPEARILISVREQRSMIVSTYKQYVRVGGTMALEGYLDPPRKGRARAPGFDFEHFAYHRLVALYQDLFGSEDVLVLPYEHLRSDPQGYLRDIVRFARTDTGTLPATDMHPNRALSGLATVVRRWSNRFVAHDRVHPGLFGSPDLDRAVLRTLETMDTRLPRTWSRRSDDHLADTVAEAVADRYRESNRITARCTGLDLGALGYDV